MVPRIPTLPEGWVGGIASPHALPTASSPLHTNTLPLFIPAPGYVLWLVILGLMCIRASRVCFHAICWLCNTVAHFEATAFPRHPLHSLFFSSYVPVKEGWDLSKPILSSVQLVSCFSPPQISLFIYLLMGFLG